MVFWFFKKKDDHEIHKLKENLNHSFSNIKNDIQSVHNVLKHFKEKHERHDEKHNLHNERFNKIEDQISRIYEILAQNNRHSSERSIVHERSRAFKRSDQSFMNVQSLQNLKENLTPAQKRIIQLLNLAEIPLEYGDLAKELKISVITVRRHINDIKRMGFDIKEKMNVDTKRKIFYIESGLKRAIRSKK